MNEKENDCEEGKIRQKAGRAVCSLFFYNQQCVSRQAIMCWVAPWPSQWRSVTNRRFVQHWERELDFVGSLFIVQMDEGKQRDKQPPS